MRLINEIVVHCTATPEGREFSVKQIDAMHRQRGFDGIGYHYLIGLDGKVHAGRPVERAGAHVAGRNASTIGVSYVGGVDSRGRPKDTRTEKQKSALESLLMQLCDRFPTIVKIEGHRAYANKACPCFDAAAEYSHLVRSTRPAAPAASRERYRLKGAVPLLAAPAGEERIVPAKNAVIETTGERSGDWVEVTQGETLGWVHDTSINQREVPEARATSRTLLGAVISGSGALGTGATAVAQALEVLRDAAPWILGLSVALTVAGVLLTTYAKMNDTQAGAET